MICGNCLEVMKGLPDNSIDSIVTDPPMEFNHTCRKCKHLKLTYAKYNKEWTCIKRNKDKAFDQTIFNNFCRDFESKEKDCE